MRACLNVHKFVPLNATTAEVYETRSPRPNWELDALRVQVDNERLNNSARDLLSLDEIMLQPHVLQPDLTDVCEAYIMLDGSIDDKEDHECPYTDSTLIVRRANLQFNNK